MPGVKLKWLKIHSYRNVRPGTELRFDDGINLVLGQNGSGKTTLLGLLTCVAGNDFSPLAEQVFDLEFELAHGTFSASVQVRNRRTKRPFHYEYEYDARLSHPEEPRTCRIVGSSTRTTVSIDGDAHDFPPSTPFIRGFLGYYLDQLPQESPLRSGIWGLLPTDIARFDESLDAYLAMTGRHPVAQAAGTPAVASMSIAVTSGGSQTSQRFTPENLSQYVARAHALPGGEYRPYLESHSEDHDFSFLTKAALLMGFHETGWKPQITTSAIDPVESAHVFSVQGSAFTFTRHDGTTINHDLLSYGQKRLLAYFYYLAATEHFVIADELVNGLHHRWIAACMEAIGDRQAFLTSQNPLLFEYIEFDSIEQVETCFITCKTELVDGAEQLVWQNLPPADARSFFESYQVGIESVGDILMTRALW